MSALTNNDVDPTSGVRESVRIRNLHIITRFDKGGSAENTFLTVTGLDPKCYETFLIAGSDGQYSEFPSGSRSTICRRHATFNNGNRTRRSSHGQDADGDAESAATAENMAQLRTSGIKTYLIPELVRRVDPILDLRAFARTRRLIRLLSPHIVHTHTSKAGIIGRLAAFSTRVPVIVHTPHGHVFWGYFGAVASRFFIALEKIAARATDRLIMLTDQERADHLHFRIAPPDKFVVIPSGVPPERFCPLAPEERRRGNEPAIPPDAFVIGTAGRLTAIKGQRYLLEAAAILARKIPQLICVVVGAGELRRELEEQAGALGIGKQTLFPGWQQDIGAYISALDVFAMPSLNEGMGRVVVEAMAAGKAVVASDVGGLKSLVVHGENGLLVPAGNAESLAGAIMSLYKDPERRRAMGEDGRKKAPAFSAGIMIMKIDELYQELLREKHVW